MRSFSGINPDIILSKVVLPLPVPPETKILVFALTKEANISAILSVRVPNSIKLSIVNGTSENRRIDKTGPSSDKGGIIAFTREPSGSRASTMGLDSSMRRPILATIFSIIFNK